MAQAPQVQTAVLVPVTTADDGELSVVFTKRALTLRRQPGEISFPGGHREADDEDDKRTALRETSEELGVSVDDIAYVGALDVLVAWSGLVVYPHVGFVPPLAELRPNADEVAEVFAVPMRKLLAMQPKVYDVAIQPQPPADFPYEWVQGGRNYKWRTTNVRQYFYPVGEHIIWGLTARILKHFLDVIRTQDSQ